MRKYLPFILIVLMIFIILGFSSQSGDTSNGMSKGIANVINEFLLEQGDMNYSPDKINLILRKIAHFLEYQILGVLLVIGFNNVLKKIIPSFAFALIFGGILAYGDELFQRISVGRTSSLFDVMVDCTGIVAGIIVSMLIYMYSTNLNKATN